MNSRSLTIACSIGAALVAVVLGYYTANGAWTLPALLIGGLVAAGVVRLTGFSWIVWVLAGLLFGNVVGNRGFAQLLLLGSVPALPAEVGLAIAAITLVWHSARAQIIPLRADSLNVAILVWLVVGTARFLFDVRGHGVDAIRDFATVYYATFFFIAQWATRDLRDRRFLQGTFMAAVVVLVPVYFTFQLRPEWFLHQFTVREWPIIYLKPDLVLTFFAAGAATFPFWCRHRGARWVGLVGLTGLVLLDESRAAALGVIAVALWLLAARRPLVPAVQLGAATLAALVLIVLAIGFQVAPAEAKWHAMLERARSVADPTGAVEYQTEESGAKGDNNRFRWVWWREVAEETWRENPVFGLGFGHDLSRQFVQSYYPEIAEEFSARSPHSIWMTAWGRLGLVGALTWLGVTLAFARRTWTALRSEQADAIGGMLGAWAVYVSACFGVVLEGPMGAVVFWTLLGLANGALPGKLPAAASAEFPQGRTLARARAASPAVVLR